MQKLTRRFTCHVGRAWGGVPLFDGRGRASRVECPVPVVLSEWGDAEGRDYVMVVNNSQSENGEVRVWIRGRRPRVAQIGWEGAETLYGAPDGRATMQGTDFVRFCHWLAPGQMELLRVEDGD